MQDVLEIDRSIRALEANNGLPRPRQSAYQNVRGDEKTRR
jgi:hypothetical protein